MIVESELNFGEDDIYSCMQELESKEDRNELLARLTSEKLMYYNKLYIEKFDKVVDDLYDCAVNENTAKMSVLLNRLSNVLYKVQKSELALYKSLRCKK